MGLSNQTSDSTQYFSTGSFADFKSNGTYTIAYDTTYESGTYTVTNDNLTIINALDTTNLKIVNLTNNAAQLYNSGSDNSGGFTYIWENWINMSK